VGDDLDGIYMVMDYIEGDSLSALFKREAVNGRRVPLHIAVRILSDALSGLHAAHELKGETGQPLGLVHRDFSPQNIRVGIDGVARLTDFGVAKIANRQAMTRSGIVKGKVRY